MISRNIKSRSFNCSFNFVINTSKVKSNLQSWDWINEQDNIEFYIKMLITKSLLIKIKVLIIKINDFNPIFRYMLLWDIYRVINTE